MLDRLHDLFWNLRSRWETWVYWSLTGWPFSRRCPSCAGSGKYSTEVMARYGDKPHDCSQCAGTGRIPR